MVIRAQPHKRPHPVDLAGRQFRALDLSTTWDRSHLIGLATAETLAQRLGVKRTSVVVAAACQDAGPGGGAGAQACSPRRET